MIHCLSAIVVASLLVSSQAYVSSRANTRMPRVKPVSENFGLEFAEDQFENSERLIAGEANYKNFVASYAPDGLVLGGPSYDVITRLRELKLLTLTAESGLLQALEAKGLTLSQVEKLLPLVDDLGLLPLLANNKGLVLNTVLPLLIEPAPLLLPVVVSVLKTNPSTFLGLGAGLVGFGLYEELDNILLGLPFVLLGLPLLVLNAVLTGSISLPTPSSGGAAPAVRATAASSSSGRPMAAKRVSPAVAAPVAPVFASAPVVAAAPKVAAPVAVAAAPKTVVASNAPRRVRKTVRIN